MSQADMEKAYAEAVDALARAVESNRLLTERLEMYEMQLAALRRKLDRTDSPADDEQPSG